MGLANVDPICRRVQGCGTAVSGLSGIGAIFSRQNTEPLRPLPDHVPLLTAGASGQGQAWTSARVSSQVEGGGGFHVSRPGQLAGLYVFVTVRWRPNLHALKFTLRCVEPSGID